MKSIQNHPSLLYAQDISTLCQPLLKLNISYFAHVHIDLAGHFSGVSNNAAFGEHYLKNKYYNADIHMASENKFGHYVIWDAIERSGQSLKMHSEAAEFGVRHTFTIIEKDHTGKHFYHFANNSPSPTINQVYLTNIDLLKLFIAYFKDNIKQSKLLAKAYDIKFKLDTTAKGYIIKTDDKIRVPEIEFIRELKLGTHFSNHALSKRQLDCLYYLIRGMTVKEISNYLNLSPKTVEHYLDAAKIKLNCFSRSGLIQKALEIFLFKSSE